MFRRPIRLISAARYTSTYMALYCLNTLGACGTAHRNQHGGYAQSVIGSECSNDLKESELCIIAFRNSFGSTIVLNNIAVKERNSTICRHACFGVLRLISAAWYTSTYLALLY